MAPRAPHPVVPVGAGASALQHAMKCEDEFGADCDAPLMSPLSDAHQGTVTAPEDYDLFFSFAHVDAPHLERDLIADPFAKPQPFDSVPVEAVSPSSSRHSLIRPAPSLHESDVTLEPVGAVEPNAELLNSLDEIFSVNHTAAHTADLTFTDDDAPIDAIASVPAAVAPAEHADPLADCAAPPAEAAKMPAFQQPVIPHEPPALGADALVDHAGSVRVLLPLSKKGWSDKHAEPLPVVARAAVMPAEAVKLRKREEPTKIRKRPSKNARRHVNQPAKKRSRNALRVAPLAAPPPNRGVIASVAAARAAADTSKHPDPPVRERCVRCSTPAKSTPMMRKGPDGCRSLCNACGLKWSRHGIY